MGVRCSCSRSDAKCDLDTCYGTKIFWEPVGMVINGQKFHTCNQNCPPGCDMTGPVKAYDDAIYAWFKWVNWLLHKNSAIPSNKPWYQVAYREDWWEVIDNPKVLQSWDAMVKDYALKQ